MSLPSIVSAAAPVVVAGAKTASTVAQSLRHPVTAVVAVTAIAGVTLIALKKKKFSFSAGPVKIEASD